MNKRYDNEKEAASKFARDIEYHSHNTHKPFNIQYSLCDIGTNDLP